MAIEELCLRRQGADQGRASEASVVEYRVLARRTDARGSLAVAKEAQVMLDTDLAGRRDAMNPVE